MLMAYAGTASLPTASSRQCSLDWTRAVLMTANLALTQAHQAVEALVGGSQNTPLTLEPGGSRPRQPLADADGKSPGRSSRIMPAKEARAPSTATAPVFAAPLAKRDQDDANIEDLRNRLLQATEAFRRLKVRRSIPQAAATRAVRAIAIAGTALLEYQAANSNRPAAGRAISSFATKAAREIISAETAVVAMAGARERSSQGRSAAASPRRRPFPAPSDASRRHSRIGSSTSKSPDLFPRVAGEMATTSQNSVSGGHHRGVLPSGEASIVSSASTSAISRTVEAATLAEWARLGKYHDIMAAARESVWQDVGIDVRSVRSSASSASGTGQTLVESLRKMRLQTRRERDAERATASRIASTGEHRFRQRQRDIGDPRTINELAIGADGLRLLQGSHRLVSSFSLQAQGVPSLGAGDSAWNETLAGRQRQGTARAAAYADTMASLDESLGCASGLDDVVSEADSDCRSEGIWAAAGVGLDRGALRSPSRRTRLAWGSSRRRTGDEDDLLRERHLHRSTRTRSASRERSRSVAGLDAKESMRRRALRRQVATLRDSGGTFAGPAAIAFEALLDETLGPVTASARDFGFTRARMQQSVKTRSHSASPARCGGLPQGGCPTDGGRQPRAGDMKTSERRSRAALESSSPAKATPGVSAHQVRRPMSPAPLLFRSAALPDAGEQGGALPGKEPTSLERLDQLLGKPPARRATATEVKLATRRAHVRHPSREALQNHSQSAWAVALNVSGTE